MARLTTSNFGDCLTVGEAADFLGVSTATLRNWDRTGKLTPRRHPQNGYRIYLHEELEKVLRSADLTAPPAEHIAPHVDWAQIGDTEHFVQFYESEEFLIQSLSGFVAAALRQGDASIVVATAQHRVALERSLIACRLDVVGAIASGQLVILDAKETLARFMVDGMPDIDRFKATVVGVIEQLVRGGRRLHAFGEMVALLWAEGNRDAAIRLEELWNELSLSYRFSLFCAYPIAGFDEESHSAMFEGICSCHSRVIPAESYAAIPDPDQRLRAIASLQQKARSLETEIKRLNQNLPLPL